MSGWGALTLSIKHSSGEQKKLVIASLILGGMYKNPADTDH